MKSLLSVMAVGVLSATTIISLTNQITFNERNDKLKHFSQQIQSEQIYWTTDHSEYEVKTEYVPNGLHGKFFNPSVNIGKKTISDYKWVSVIDPNQKSYTKTSWGNDAYWGDSFRKIQKFDINRIFQFNKKISNWKDAWANVTINLLTAQDGQGLAKMWTRHTVGLAYYSESGENYIQIFGFHLVEISTSLSGGAMWTNLGQGIELS